jgi:hypothetical protein
MHILASSMKMSLMSCSMKTTAPTFVTLHGNTVASLSNGCWLTAYPLGAFEEVLYVG